MKTKRTTSSLGTSLIKQNEGFRPNKYLDSKGVLTIGYGTIYKPGMPDPMSEPEAIKHLHTDLLWAEQAVNDLVTIELNQNEFDAMVDFVYNEGRTHLSHSTLLVVLNAGKRGLVQQELLKWDYSGGKEVEGLENRRKAEWKLFNTPVTS